MKKAPMCRLPGITTSLISECRPFRFLLECVLGYFSSERECPLLLVPATLVVLALLLSVNDGSTSPGVWRAVIALDGVTSTVDANDRFARIVLTLAVAWPSFAVPALEAGALCLRGPTEFVEEAKVAP